MEVAFTTDAAEAWARAEEFLTVRPVEHNLILTLLYSRTVMPQDGRYWTVEHAGRVSGFVFQSPTTFKATLTPMPPELVDAAVEAAAAEADLPGIIGDATAASRFAGRWTELRKGAARPTAGQRLYELKQLDLPTGVGGTLRLAADADVPLLVEWMHGFNNETDERGTDPAEMVPLRVAAGQFYVWDHDGPVSTAAATPAIAGVTRVQAVYTPPENRNRGYAAATVGAISHQMTSEGLRCVLYTDLANPISNSVYRRIGYRAVNEILRYEFVTP
jgi:GNAT superfamily N-acetyltransferase